MSDSLRTEELMELITLEKASLVDPGAARERLAQRLAQHLPAAPERASGAVKIPPTPAVSPAAARLVSGLALFGAGAIVGAAAHGMWGPGPVVRYVDRVVEVAAPARAMEALPAPLPSPTSSASQPSPSAVTPAIEPPRTSHRASSAAPSPTAQSDDDLARERQVIERARSALARRDPEGALGAVDQHATEFPRGQLTEMREALAVQALVSGGRAAEARARAQRFHHQFPTSMYGSVVDGAISSIP